MTHVTVERRIGFKMATFYSIHLGFRTDFELTRTGTSEIIFLMMRTFST